MTIFFSVGEPSGDLHGANLIHAIRAQCPTARFVGFGGPRMAAAGCELHFELTSLAVMWVLRVLVNLHRFLHLCARADHYFRHHRPDAVVLIDYPGFNWWIAWRAKLLGIPVFYYAPPQIWAWASWRVKKMRRYVDHVLCSLPFEEAWFKQRGCNATFVGHPYFDEVRGHALDAGFISQLRLDPRPLVTLLPGSRTQEVEQNLRWFLKAASTVLEQVPNARFAVAAFKASQAQFATRLITAAGLPIEVYVRRTPELIAAAHCCLAVSGSVSLELLYHRRPTVILYWVPRWAYRVQSWFRKVRYITLVNLLTARELFPGRLEAYDPDAPGAEQVPFPEYLTWQDRSADIARRLVGWLTDEAKHQQSVAQLTELRQQVAHGGASRRAAEYLLGVLAARRTGVPRPHFRRGMRVASSALADRAA
ncbi:MAG: lipid-A-disaccharide synthase [Planctomycetes bacterium]|nr:lipid-A-disaccharide synthase [Planctomycetota bacterium]